MIENILIVKTSSLGDIIHVFPTIGFLKIKFPKAKIDWVVERPFKALVEAHPSIHKVITIDSKKWRKSWLSKEVRGEIKAFRKELQSQVYDVVFDLQGNIKSGLVTGSAKSKNKVGFAKNSVPEWPNLLFTNHRYNPKQNQNIRVDYLYLAQSYFNDFSEPKNSGIILNINDQERQQIAKLVESFPKGQKLAIVCPGSNWKNKQLTEQSWIDFLLHMQQDYYFLFAWGTEEEHSFVKNLKAKIPNSTILSKMSLPVLQNLMAKMDLVLAVDSLPLHLAGTTSTQTISFFGASSENKYKPIGASHKAIQGHCPYGRTFEKRCPILRTCETGACIRDVSGNELFQKWTEGT